MTPLIPIRRTAMRAYLGYIGFLLFIGLALAMFGLLMVTLSPLLAFMGLRKHR